MRPLFELDTQQSGDKYQRKFVKSPCQAGPFKQEACKRMDLRGTVMPPSCVGGGGASSILLPLAAPTPSSLGRLLVMGCLPPSVCLHGAQPSTGCHLKQHPPAGGDRCPGPSLLLLHLSLLPSISHLSLGSYIQLYSTEL